MSAPGLVFPFVYMICLVWNCQGAASISFRRTLKNFSRMYNASIVCLLEPKVSGSQANTICSSLGFEDWVRVEAVGFSGGIWIFWNPTVNVSVLKTHPQFVNLQVDDRRSQPWILTIVYGSPNLMLRRRLFTDLSLQNLGSHHQWLAVGDFNSVIGPNEVSNSECFNQTRCTDFNEWIFREGLMDLNYRGAKFTWSRGLNTQSYRAARLDRALGNTEWLLRFPDAMIEHLPMVESDHTPLLLNTNPGDNRGGEGILDLIWHGHLTTIS